MGNDDENTRTGASLNSGIDLLISKSADPESVFFGHLDLDRIGVGGRSQGGCAVYNMATT